MIIAFSCHFFGDFCKVGFYDVGLKREIGIAQHAFEFLHFKPDSQATSQGKLILHRNPFFGNKKDKNVEEFRRRQAHFE